MMVAVEYHMVANQSRIEQQAQTRYAPQRLAENQQGTQGAHVNKHTKKRSQPDLEKRTIRLTLLTQQSGKNNPLSSQCYTGGGKTRASLGNLAWPVTLQYAVAFYATRLLFWVL